MSTDRSPGRAAPEPPAAAPVSRPARRGLAGRVSRRERVALFVHRGLDRWLSPLGVWVYRRTKGGITGPWKVDALLLTTRGRRSGRERTVVLQFFPDGDAMIVAAANDGGTSHPGWYYNLAAEPAAHVEVMGRTIAVRATELPPDEAAAAWERILRRDPSYERYARAAAGRTIPVLRLDPVTEPA
jgi:deazaflavin-dependent oxidoreductase (nitroreductase family)